MPLTFPGHHVGLVGYSSPPAPVVSQNNEPSTLSAKRVSTSCFFRRLASRSEASVCHTRKVFLKARQGARFTIICHRLGKCLGQISLLERVGFGKKGLVQIRKAKKLEGCLNKFELGSQVNLRPEDPSIRSSGSALGTLLKRVDSTAKKVSGSSHYHQLNHLRAQHVGGIQLREMCESKMASRAGIKSLTVDDQGLAAAQVRVLGYGLLALKGNPDIEADKASRPDLQAVSVELMSAIGGRELVLTALNKISRAKPLAPGSTITVTAKELEALRTAMVNETVTYRWIDSLVNSSRDLQAVLDIALE